MVAFTWCLIEPKWNQSSIKNAKYWFIILVSQPAWLKQFSSSMHGMRLTPSTIIWVIRTIWWNNSDSVLKKVKQESESLEIVKSSSVLAAMRKFQSLMASSSRSVAMHCVMTALEDICRKNSVEVQTAYFQPAQSTLVGWSFLIVYFRCSLIQKTTNNLSTTRRGPSLSRSLGLSIVQAKTVRRHARAKQKICLMFNVSAERISALLAPMKLTNLLIASFCKSGQSASRDKMRTLWTGWSCTLKSAQHARFQSRKTKDVCIWHVETVNLNFAGCASRTIKITTTAISFKRNSKKKTRN